MLRPATRTSESQAPFALIHDPDLGHWFQLHDPAWIVSTSDLDQVRPLLAEGTSRRDGKARICCIAYEAAGAFDRSLASRRTPGQLLLWMAGFRSVTQLNAAALAAGDPMGEPADEQVGEDMGEQPGRPVLFGPWQAELSDQAYAAAFQAVKAHLSAGDAYQINLTQRYRAALLETPSPAALRRLFVRIALHQECRHAALIDTGDTALLSFSPESFVERRGSALRCRPMKGTAARGTSAAADRAAVQGLLNSAKERAENLMIVDMVRNDLGRIAQVGSVQVPTLFTIEPYPSVHQMTSEVTARSEAGDDEVLGALFPCASVTGAPKVAAMSIIAELEQSARGFYTGTIGALLGDGRSFWNVAIRTLSIHRRAGLAEYGSGGGIVWDSRLADELAELRLKAHILADTAPDFSLIETMRLQGDGELVLRERHLARLRKSAEVFGFRFDAASIRSRLTEAARQAADRTAEEQILRLVLNPDGSLSITETPLRDRPIALPLRVRLASRPVSADDILLRHKTTDRWPYRAACGGPPMPDPAQGEEVFLFNERSELTEGTFTNIVLALDGHWYTPPIDAGLLPGCYRAELLAQGVLTEKTLAIGDLARADSVWAINSVRGMMPCVLDRDPS